MKNEKEKAELQSKENPVNSETAATIISRRRKFSIKPAPYIQEMIEHSRRWREDVNYHWNTGAAK